MNQVQVTCYRKTETYPSVAHAKAFFLDCAVNTEGSEQGRYISILAQLEDGLLICSDENSDY